MLPAGHKIVLYKLISDCTFFFYFQLFQRNSTTYSFLSESGAARTSGLHQR